MYLLIFLTHLGPRPLCQSGWVVWGFGQQSSLHPPAICLRLLPLLISFTSFCPALISLLYLTGLRPWLVGPIVFHLLPPQLLIRSPARVPGISPRWKPLMIVCWSLCRMTLIGLGSSLFQLLSLVPGCGVCLFPPLAFVWIICS